MPICLVSKSPCLVTWGGATVTPSQVAYEQPVPNVLDDLVFLPFAQDVVCELMADRRELRLGVSVHRGVWIGSEAHGVAPSQLEIRAFPGRKAWRHF
jgi:hypothetical protein